MHLTTTRSRNVLVRADALAGDDFFDEGPSSRAEAYCTWGDCERPVSVRGGKRRPYCDLHEKRKQRGTPMDAPVQERLSPKARALELAIAWADASSEAGSDGENQDAERSFYRGVRALAPQLAGELVREGMARARQRGVHVGRPLKVSPQQARALVDRLGSVTLAAQALGVSRAAVRRALGGTKGGLSCHADRGAERNERAPSVPPDAPSAR